MRGGTVEEELQLALWGVVSDLQMTTYLRALTVLHDLGLTSQDDELQQVFGLQDGVSDNDLFRDRTLAVLTTAVESALLQYGVTVVEGTELRASVAILDSLSRVEHYLLPTHLRDIAATEDDPVEVIAGVVEVVAGDPGVGYEECLAHVEPATVTRLEQIMADRIALEEPPVPVSETALAGLQVINRLRRAFGPTVPEGVTRVVEFLQGGYQPGTSVELLLEGLCDNLDLDTLRTEQMGDVLLLIWAFSDEFTRSHQPEAFQPTIAAFTDDPEEQRRISVAMTQRLNEVTHADY